MTQSIKDDTLTKQIEDTRSEQETKLPSEVIQEYEYSIRPAAVETLVNVLLKYGIDLRGSHFDPMKDSIVFHSDRLIDLKKMRRDRIIGSYTISKVVHTKEIIEKG